MVRDADSRITLKDRKVIDLWTADGTPFMCARDNLRHRREIMGGLWGGTRDFVQVANLGSVLEMTTETRSQFNWTFYAADQHWLRQYVWPNVKEVASQFDIRCCNRSRTSRDGLLQVFCPRNSTSICRRTPSGRLFLGMTYGANDTVVCEDGSCHIGKKDLESLWSDFLPDQMLAVER